MKKIQLANKLLVLFLLFIAITGCEEGDVQPLDIITQKQDLEELYYKGKFVIPAKISGVITNKLTNEKIVGAKITARLSTSDTKYTTYSVAGGVYTLHVEGSGSPEYVICATNDGFDKRYFIDSYTKDTAVNISNDQTANFSLAVSDQLPIFAVNYMSTKYLSYDLTDLTFDGTNLCGILSNYLYQYDTEGVYKKFIALNVYSQDIVANQDTVYWILDNYNSRTLYKMGQKSGKQITSVTAQVPLTSYKDVEVSNNNFWLLSATQLYKLSMTGEQLLYVNFSTLITDLNLVSITKFGNYLYLLNKLNDSQLHKYCIYKFDPASGSIVSKGFLPDNLNSFTLRGLAADTKNFWTIYDLSYEDELIRFSITE